METIMLGTPEILKPLIEPPPPKEHAVQLH